MTVDGILRLRDGTLPAEGGAPPLGGCSLAPPPPERPPGRHQVLLPGENRPLSPISILPAASVDLPDAQRFYESRAYGGGPIDPTDFVVLARHDDRVVGVGRLCQEKGLLWLRGMQVEPRYQRLGIGTRILRLLVHEAGTRWCCCLPYRHLVPFYRRAGFELPKGALPPELAARLESYLVRGLDVVAMVRPE